MCNNMKKYHSVQATYKPPRLTLLNTTLPITPVRLHTRTKLTPVGKEYLCFQINSKSPRADQCVKTRILNKAIGYILYIDTF